MGRLPGTCLQYAWCCQVSCFHKQYIISSLPLLDRENSSYCRSQHFVPPACSFTPEAHQNGHIQPRLIYSYWWCRLCSKRNKTAHWIQDSWKSVFPLLHERKRVKQQLLIFSSSNISPTLLTFLCHLLYSPDIQVQIDTRWVQAPAPQTRAYNLLQFGVLRRVIFFTVVFFSHIFCPVKLPSSSALNKKLSGV